VAPEIPAWFDHAPGPLMLFSGDRVVAVSPTACAELRRAPEDLLDEAFVAGLLPEDADRLRSVLADLAADEVAPDIGDDVFRVVRAQGGPQADFIELRMRRLDADLVAAVVIDASQEHRLDAVVGALADSTFIVDEHGELVWRPLGNARRLGVDDEEALGALTLEWIHPEDLPELLRLFNELLAEPGGRRTAHLRARQPYVEHGWIIARLTGVNRLDDPAVRGIIVRSEEMVDPAILDSVGRTAGQFQSLAEAAPIGILVTNVDGRVLYRNELARELLGGGAGAEHWIDQARRNYQDDLTALATRALEKQERGSMLVPFDFRGGTTWVEVTAVPQTDEAGRPFGLIATLKDVTAETEAREDLRAAQDRLWHMANHDQLTGLPNRSLLMDRLDQALARHRRDHHGVAILYSDLDGFKAINDEHGHATGDLVLVEIARRLSAAVRNTDTVCRFGGDEYLVLLEGFSDADEVVTIAARIVEDVAQPLASVGNASVGITVGAAIARDDQGPGALLAQADNAMYRAKALGKGRYELYGESPARRAPSGEWPTRR
jgi:diguanylate cyclase (GGDEF)-like protein/PAS domain S-box-containing protein